MSGDGEHKGVAGAGASRLGLVHRFFAGTGSSYDATVTWATLGFDRLWKRRIVNRIPRDATRILDLACGTGISTLAIVRRLPHAHVVGVDVQDEYLGVAIGKVARMGVCNVQLVRSAAEDYWNEKTFDCITSSYLAKYADLPRLVPRCYAMLRPGGVFIMHDFIYPGRPWLVWIWRNYFRLLQTVGGRFLPAWREIFYGLPELIEQTGWLPELEAQLRAAGFTDVRVEYLFAYGAALVSARRPDGAASGYQPSNPVMGGAS